jgi:hypothetical protein
MSGRGDPSALTWPLPLYLPLAVDVRTQDKQQGSPRALPVTVAKQMGEHVQVNADLKGNFTIPKWEISQGFSQWIRLPTQENDQGLLLLADHYLGGHTNLGGGTASYYSQPNLTPAVFIPTSRSDWSSRDYNAVLINGPNGVVLQDQAGNCVVTINKTSITLKDKNGTEVYLDGNGNVFVYPGAGICYLGAKTSAGCFPVSTTGGASDNVYAHV